MNNIKISVLMPAYNSENFISKSIESIILLKVLSTKVNQIMKS